MRLLGGLHAAAEVLQVKAHDVIQAIHALQPGVQPVPVHLHLLPAHGLAYSGPGMRQCNCRTVEGT